MALLWSKASKPTKVLICDISTLVQPAKAQPHRTVPCWIKRCSLMLSSCYMCQSMAFQVSKHSVQRLANPKKALFIPCLPANWKHQKSISPPLLTSSVIPLNKLHATFPMPPCCSNSEKFHRLLMTIQSNHIPPYYYSNIFSWKRKEI